ncbi:small lysine-rich protein 1 [Palaemon carinicauda]|uniref:small lysine-rich protein 1 n=1 Tax=Palaemon carinicauda TaxID=392227 RepID=UPI0035B6404F
MTEDKAADKESGGGDPAKPEGEQPSPPKSPEKKAEKGGKKKAKKKSSKESGGGKGRIHVDILGETAMQNALYICHSVQELLFWRGYQWAPGGKKPKKGKK